MRILAGERVVHVPDLAATEPYIGSRDISAASRVWKPIPIPHHEVVHEIGEP
jgi:hypothetical protein